VATGLSFLMPARAEQVAGAAPATCRRRSTTLLDNVDVLSDLPGMDLVLDAAEHAVGDFRLDLIGKDLATDRTVIVENQLETSNHDHLGQILTYAAGSKATTIVWDHNGLPSGAPGRY
jgi:hypothetical protein